MNFEKLKNLSREIDVINAFMNNEEISFDYLFEDALDFNELTEEYKLNKICELISRVFYTVKLEDTSHIENMLNKHYNNDKIGKFCVGFIRMQIDGAPDAKFETKLNFLLSLDVESVPMSQIKIDYYQATLHMLLYQQPLNLELINYYNNQLKDILNNIK